MTQEYYIKRGIEKFKALEDKTQTQPKYEYLRPALTNMRDNHYTYQQCADNLNLMGTLTPNNSKWCSVKVSRALTYLGVI